MSLEDLIVKDLYGAQLRLVVQGEESKALAHIVRIVKR